MLHATLIECHPLGSLRTRTVTELSDLRIRAMRPDEIAIAIDWAAAEGWKDASVYSRYARNQIAPEMIRPH
jgi:hypothetical protein